MLVEVSGLSSAGKSTLLAALANEQPPAGYRTVSIGADRILSVAKLTGLRGPARRLALTAFSLAGWLGAGPQRWRAAGTLLRAHKASALPARSWSRWNGTTNAAMQLGLLHLLQRVASEDELILLDTGPVHTTYNFFVDIDTPPNPAAAADYLASIPMADVVVWLDQDRDVIIERTLSRGHRRVKNLDRQGAEAFHDNATTAFTSLHSGSGSRLVRYDLREGTPPSEQFFESVLAAA